MKHRRTPHRRHGKGTLAAVALLTFTGVLAGFTAPAAAAPNTPNTAAAVLADKPAFLHATAHDRFVQRSATDFAGLRFLAYDRTYRGLAVVGGDFVLVTDGRGQVVDQEVAQTRSIGELSTTPAIDATAAASIAGRELTTVDSTDDTRLVVDALGDTARLAWEATVTGTGTDGPSSLTVHVDALTGAVLDSREHIHYGTGTSGWEGTVPLETTQSDGTYSMLSPNTRNMP